jgi:predicted glycosyltransferase
LVKADLLTAEREQACHLDMDFGDAVRMQASLILSAASVFAPDTVLIDKKPLGVAGEVGPMLNLMATRQRPPKVHLLLRERPDSPEATRGVWESHNHHGAINRHYGSALDPLGENRDFHRRTIGGPELGDVPRRALSRRACVSSSATWLDFSDAMGREIDATDLVISMGG